MLAIFNCNNVLFESINRKLTIQMIKKIVLKFIYVLGLFVECVRNPIRPQDSNSMFVMHLSMRSAQNTMDTRGTLE